MLLLKRQKNLPKSTKTNPKAKPKDTQPQFSSCGNLNANKMVVFCSTLDSLISIYLTLYLVPHTGLSVITEVKHSALFSDQHSGSL